MDPPVDLFTNIIYVQLHFYIPAFQVNAYDC